MTWVDKSSVKEALVELADGASQDRSWLAASGPEVGSLTECLCWLLDDSGLGAALERSDVVFSHEIDASLLDLGRLVHNLEAEHLAPDVVLVDPRLHNIRAVAATVLYEIVRLEVSESRFER